MPIGPEFRDLTDARNLRLLRVVEVRTGFKNLSLIVEIEGSQGTFEALFRPETGVRVSWDPRVPKPQELYRDCAFHLVDKSLHWDVTAPVVPFNSRDLGKGVVRPYWRQARTLEDFQLTGSSMKGDFWLKAAILDYICGVIDRNHNDLLLLNGDGPVLIDSGLSFVTNVDFVAQKSVLRERRMGQDIPGYLMDDILRLNKLSLAGVLRRHLGSKEIKSFFARVELIKERARIL